VLFRAADPRIRRKRPALILATIGMTFALSLTGCSLSKDQQTPSANNSGPAAGAEFTAQTASGAPITIPGGRPSVILFFSVECGACGPTAKALAQVQGDDPRAANFLVVDVTSYETDTDIKNFLADNHASTLGRTNDPDGHLVRTYAVSSTSTVVILDANNNVAYRAYEPTADKIRSELAKVPGS
jgi:hypothetical protein